MSLKQFKDIDNIEKIQNIVKKLEEKLPNLDNMNQDIQKLMEQSNNNQIINDKRKISVK